MALELTPEQSTLIERYHLQVDELGKGFLVTDRDPALGQKKRPHYEGADLDKLLARAADVYDARHANDAPQEEEAPATAPQEEEAPATAPQAPDNVILLPPPAPSATILPFRASAAPAADPAADGNDKEEAPKRPSFDDDALVLTDVVLDHSDARPARTPKKRGPKGDGRRTKPNRPTRVLQVLLENPDNNCVAELAKMADVTEAMLVYYQMQLKTIARVFREFGALDMPSVERKFDKDFSTLVEETKQRHAAE